MLKSYYSVDEVVSYLPQGNNGKQANEAHGEEKANHPSQRKILHVDWGVPFICLRSNSRAHT